MNQYGRGDQHTFQLYNIPSIFSSMAKLAAGNTSTQAVIANRDRLILERIRKVVFALCHGSHENTDALFRAKGLDVVSDSNNLSVEAQCDFATVWWEMVCDRVFDDFEKLLL